MCGKIISLECVLTSRSWVLQDSEPVESSNVSVIGLPFHNEKPRQAGEQAFSLTVYGHTRNVYSYVPWDALQILKTAADVHLLLLLICQSHGQDGEYLLLTSATRSRLSLHIITDKSECALVTDK